LTLKSIEWTNGKVELDLTDYLVGGNYYVNESVPNINLGYMVPAYKVNRNNSNLGSIKLINNIKVFDRSNNLIKGFNLSYIHNNTQVAEEKRPFLNKIQEFTSTDKLPSYVFEYDLNYPEHPNVLKFNTDYWGYFNYDFDHGDNRHKHNIPWLKFKENMPQPILTPYTSSNLISQYLNPLALNNTDCLSPFRPIDLSDDQFYYYQPYNSEFYQGYYYNRNSRPSITYGMLERIEYPTGGADNFYYTLDSLKYIYAGVEKSIIGGGVKISMLVREFADPNKTQLIKKYFYPWGNLEYLPQFARSYFAKVDNINEYFVLHAKYGSALNSPSGPIKTYPYVTERTVGSGKITTYFHDLKNQNIPTNASNMMLQIDNMQPNITQIIFKTPAHYTQYQYELDKYPYGSITNNWVKSKIWKIEEFNENNNIVRSTLNEYDFIIVNNHLANTVTLINDIVKAGDPSALSVGTNGVFKFTKQHHLDGFAKLNKTTSTTYDNNNTKNNIVEYLYNSKNKIRSVINHNSNGIKEKQDYYYVYDFNGTVKNDIGLFPTVSEAVIGANSLLEKNIVSKPICFEKYLLKPNESPILLSSSFTMYKNFDNNTLVWKEYILNHNQQNIQKFDISNSTMDFIYDSKFKLYRTYNKYDFNCNPLEILDNNLGVVSYKWSYDSELPVAQIINGKNSYDAIGNNTSYLGFEDASNASNSSDNDYWTFNQSQTYPCLESFTGKHGMVIMPNNNEDGINREFSPEPNSEKLIVSGWVKIFNSNSLANGTTQIIVLNIEKDGITQSPINIETNQNPKEWKYFSVPIDLTQNTTSIKLNLNLGTELGNRSIVLDDIRVQPMNSTMTTYTYDPILNQVTSVSDENNRATNYEYDSFGRLVYQKDNNKNILKSNIYLYQPKN
jgi:YD repeat-containing protein